MQPSQLNVPLLQLGFLTTRVNMWFGCISEGIDKCLTRFAAGFSIYTSPVCAFYLATSVVLFALKYLSSTVCVCVSMLHSEHQIMVFICKEKEFWGSEDISWFSHFQRYVWRFRVGSRFGLKVRINLGLSVYLEGLRWPHLEGCVYLSVRVLGCVYLV